ncbi:MAG TPA: translation initiation factor IF-3 [Pirellulaceae bacterium]|nr:translation initiation factor IF-3 [Pirellulaceae bacterium]
MVISKEAARDQNRVNDQIRISPVRVIDHEGQQLGIMPVKEALAKAREVGLDLVEVAPDSSPPVCRIMDFGKFKYDKNKRSHKSKSHTTKLKEVRLRPKTGQHDIDVKIRQAVSFLQHKDKVLVTVVFRGRELAHVEEGQKVMSGILEKLLEHGKLESPPVQQAKRITCTVAPK